MCRPICNKCKYYYITFDPSTPMGCKAYGLKSKTQPSAVVKNANNGKDCIGFELKDHLKNPENAKATTKDLNDPALW